MSSFPPLPPDIGRIAGPLLIGYLLHWGLFGVLSCQVYVYYLAFPNDPWRTQALVYGVYIAELVQTLLFADTAFKTFAAGFGNIVAIIDGSILWFSVPIMSSAVAFVVQVFYAYRISVLSKNKLVAGVILLFALAQLGGGIAVGVIAHEVTLFTDFLVTKTLIATGIWNGCSAVCDILIATSMTYYLSSRGSKWKPTQRIVHRLIRLIIETGTLTAAVAIVNLALSLLPGGPTYFQTSSAVLGKMYSNTMMVVFNSRMRIGRNDDSRNATYDSNTMTASNHVSSRQPVIAASRGGVTVTREDYTMEDWSAPKRKEAGSPTTSVSA